MEEADHWVGTIKQDWHQAQLDPADRAILIYAEKLTLTPQKMTEADIDALREAGFNDRAVLEIIEITALFAYYNRLADGLGIDPEDVW
jgi:uncharacterized peroxidase-related enzyme